MHTHTHTNISQVWYKIRNQDIMDVLNVEGTVKELED